MSKYHPKSKPSAYRPLAPSVTCGDSSLPEGAMGCEPFHMGLCLWESANCESLSQKSEIFASSLWQGSLCGQCRYRAGQGSDDTQKATVRIDSGGTPPLQCPVSAACPPNLFTIHSSLFTKNARYLWLGKIPLCQRKKLFLGGQAQKNLLGHRKILPVQGRAELFFGG